MAHSDKHSKTEKPTPKRRKEARQRGQVARSMDVSGWAAVLVGSFVLPTYLNSARGRVLSVFSQSTQVMRNPTTAGALSTFEAGLRAVVLTVMPLAAGFALLGVVLNLAQTGRTFSLKAAAPKFSRLNPKSGIKRIFSSQSLIQLLRQIVKLAALSGIGYQAVVALDHELTGTQPVSLLPLIAATATRLLSFVRIVALLGMLLGVADFAFQRRKLEQSLKMTKEEVKQEARNAEGDPHLKGHLKKRMYQIARTKAVRMVRQADVVVTNPTHYAVALQYDASHGLAPRVIAKGADRLAARIRDEASTHAVPVVEDPPLARYLYAVCEIGEQIPNEIFVAVARILAFVYSLPEMTRAIAVHHPAHSSVPSEPAAMATMTEEQRHRLAAILAGTAS